MALLPLPPSALMNQDLVFSLARRRWMFASVLLNHLHPRDPPDPPDPPDPTVTSQSKPPSSSSLRDLHQTPPHSSPPISLPSISTSGFRASCFFHEIYYRGSRTETTQICLTGGGAFLSIVHVSPSSSTAMVLVCSGERNAPSVDGSSSSHGGLSFHSDSGETLIGSSFVKDRISFESPLTASHRNLISISKQLRLQPDYSKSHCLLSDAYSLTLNGNEYDDSLLKFLPVTISWPRHGNVKVRASDPIKPVNIDCRLGFEPVMGAPKQKWTQEEESALKSGVVKHGPGKWRTILKDPEFSGVLYLRSNVDLKDKWRNMSVMANGWGSRDKSRLALKRTHSLPKQDDSSLANTSSLQSDEDMADAKHFSTTGTSALQLPTTPTPRRPNVRSDISSMLDSLIMEAISTMKELGGSNKTTIGAYIEEQYHAPPDFKRLLSTKLKYLTNLIIIYKKINFYIYRNQSAHNRANIDCSLRFEPVMGAPKQKWTQEEESALKSGVVKHGPGKWRTILKDPEFSGVLYLRSNVDLKDKWRNMSVMANGWGSRDKSRLALKRTHSLPKQDDSSLANTSSLQSDEDMADAKHFSTTGTSALQLPTTPTPRRPNVRCFIVLQDCPDADYVSTMMRDQVLKLDSLIMEAISTMKELGGSNKTTIGAYIEEQYHAPPDFKRLLSTKLKYLTACGKLIKVSYESYRSIGKALGEVDKVDVDNGRFRVYINVDEPLQFERQAGYTNGDVIKVSLQYEELNRFCFTCKHISHEEGTCLDLSPEQRERNKIARLEKKEKEERAAREAFSIPSRDESYRSIGKALGEVDKVDVDNGRVRVYINVDEPLQFERRAGYTNGDVIKVSLQYEELNRFCFTCKRISHEEGTCLDLSPEQRERNKIARLEKKEKEERAAREAFSIPSR
ncbi:hypothetical protein F2Q69_00046626, partial [Brassica cretica]